MLITFSCKSHANVTMFGDIAQVLITMMEFTTDIPGAIMAEDVESALTNLENNIVVVNNQQIQHQDTPQPTDIMDEDNDEQQVKISLSVRALPLINLLKTAISVESYVMWE